MEVLKAQIDAVMDEEADVLTNVGPSIIMTDADTATQDSDDGSLYPYDPSAMDISLSEEKLSVFEFIRKLTAGKMIINPDFQRNLVWKQDQKSQFIESLIINFPLAPIYLNQTDIGQYIVIDGLQRTTTMRDFLDNKFNLTGCKALPKLNGFYFRDLEDSIRSKIEDKQLLTYILKPSTPTKIIYDIFYRINTGGTQLNRQEIRNCIFEGNSTRLLKRLSEMSVFRNAIHNGISDKRMKDREAVLRYLTFRIKKYQSYEGDISGFLEETMRIINKMDENHLPELENDFEKAMRLCLTCFGEQNFRVPSPGRSKGSVNMAVLESVSCFIAEQPEEWVLKNRAQLYQNYTGKLLQNREYLDAVQRATGDKQRVRTRFNKVHEILMLDTQL